MGAGPAGCEAALTLKKRGHNVVVFEKREIGGTMIEAGAASSTMEEASQAIRWMAEALAEAIVGDS